LRAARAPRLFHDGEAALMERLGLGIAALGVIQLGQAVQRGADTGGWSGLSLASRMASTRLASSVASAYLPCW
jgi:hypothetical protein